MERSGRLFHNIIAGEKEKARHRLSHNSHAVGTVKGSLEDERRVRCVTILRDNSRTF